MFFCTQPVHIFPHTHITSSLAYFHRTKWTVVTPYCSENDDEKRNPTMFSSDSVLPLFSAYSHLKLWVPRLWIQRADYIFLEAARHRMLQVQLWEIESLSSESKQNKRIENSWQEGEEPLFLPFLDGRTKPYYLLRIIWPKKKLPSVPVFPEQSGAGHFEFLSTPRAENQAPGVPTHLRTNLSVPRSGW